VSLNTQSSTQWDYPTEGSFTYFGGMSSDDAKDKTVTKYGIQSTSIASLADVAEAWISSWHGPDYARKPITSRAHLLDIPLYLERNGLPPISHFDQTTPITLNMLRGCAEDAGVKFQPGDVLLVRTGWTEAYLALSPEERRKLPERKVRASCGVSQTEDVLRWHWDNGIAAVASDT
jgi:hypothetical protein